MTIEAPVMATALKDLIIGIDFGTTTSSVAYCRLDRDEKDTTGQAIDFVLWDSQRLQNKLNIPSELFFKSGFAGVDSFGIRSHAVSINDPSLKWFKLHLKGSMDGLDKAYRTQIEVSKKDHPLPATGKWSSVFNVVGTYLEMLHRDLMKGLMSQRFATDHALEDYKITYMLVCCAS